jgi:photosystem II stability/assembly factor-like uncharacterized protein
MKKVLLLLLLLTFLSASCNLFKKDVPGGILKTVNGGADWLFSNKLKDSNLNLSGQNISKLVMSPLNHEHIFAGSFSGGLFFSEDSGQTWRRILSKINVYDVVVNPFNPKIIYAAGNFGTQGKLLKSSDGGGSWQEVYNEAGENNPVRAVALNVNFPNQIILGTESGTVIRSFDGGLTWKLSVDLKSRINSIAWQKDNIFVLTKSKGLFKTKQENDNFEEITSQLSGYSKFSEVFPSNRVEKFNQFYVDLFSLDLVYLTTSSGLFKTLDGGKTWNKMTLPVKNSEENRSIVVAPSSSNLVFSSVGSVIYKSTDGGNTWQTQSIPSIGIVQSILVDWQLPQVVYAGIYIPSN